ncbi:hypothetical protein Pcinc_028354 [Petrolisthes cinctipes]|uniref:Uncharacterized protein n=1 Tax=Petrolisthes cinctipes TaxID=88211 RepID=A0AAE1F2I8_PETCI|nr:hypothetical protein Pcinc_028354 [Petrolisthes cinctipes]
MGHNTEEWTGVKKQPNEVVISLEWQNNEAKEPGNSEDEFIGTMVHSEDRKRASGITEKGKTGMMEHTKAGTGITEAETKESMEQPVERKGTVVEQLQPEEETGNVDQTQNWNETMKKLNEKLKGPSRQSGNEESEMVEHTEEGAWQGRGPCTPCNSTVEAETLTLPTVGFVCLEAPPATRPSTTCLVFFKGQFNLTLHLHQFLPTHWSVSL